MVMIYGLLVVEHTIRWLAHILSFNSYNTTMKLLFYKKGPLDTERISNFPQVNI